MSRKWEVALGALVTLIGIVLLVYIIPSQVRVSASETNEISPAFFPQFVGWAFILLGLIHAGVAMVPAAEPARGAGLDAGHGVLRALATFAIGLGYLVLLPGIGFIAATTVAMSALILFFGEGPAWRAPLIALPFAWLVAFGFSSLLQTPLPRAGWLE